MISTPFFTRNTSPHRRILPRRSSSHSSTSDSPDLPSPKLQAVAITPSTSRMDTELFNPMTGETDAQCWQRMLRLQREYHCYNSARLSAAVDAEERGEAEVAVPSRLCLDLLNESLMSWIEAHREGYLV